MKAGEKSMKRFALEESHQYYRDAYDLLCTKPDRGNEEDELLVDLILEWGTVFYYTGHFKIYIDILQSHEPLVMSLRDKVRVGKFYNWLGWSHCWRADFPAAHRVLSKALELGEETHNQEVIGYASTYLCWTCAELGLFDDCMAFGQRAQDMAKLIKTDQYLHIKSLAGMGHSYWWRGEWKKVLELCQTVLAYGERHSNIRSMVMGLVGIGSAHLTHGDFTSCIESCQKAINLTEDPSYVRYASFVQAYAYMSNGQLTEALDRAENVLNYSRDVGTAWYETLTDPVFGAVTVALGRATEGLEHLKHAKQAAFAKQRRGLYVLLEYILGHIYLQMALADETVTSAAETAEDHFNKAITYGEKIGVKGTLGQAYLDLGLLHKAKKRRKKARKCLSKAVEYFELCEVETFLKQARAELKSLG
jgi:tetratricopeptide (TPR) repeat protein